MSPLERRKRAEVTAKCDSFLKDLQRWQEALEHFPQHTSQVKRLQRVFGTQAKNLAERREKTTAADSADGLAEILLLFRVWAFYRQKLDQRFVPVQDDFLRVADEVAYTWWAPARKAALRTADAKVRGRFAKEPPLLFLNGDVSPFTVTRKIAFEAEVAEGLNERLRTWSTRLLKQAPVPVVGVPYFAAGHIPDLLVIAHEVGHNVEDDFGLTKDLDQAVRDALAQASADSQIAWPAWRDEIFADLWGVLVGGLAFVDTLIDFLPNDIDAVRIEDPRSTGWGSYPTTALRAELLFTALEKLGLSSEGKQRRSEFRKRHPKHALSKLEADVPSVVDALLECKPASFAGISIRQAAGFDKDEERALAAEVSSVADGNAPASTTTATMAKVIAQAFRVEPEHVSAASRSEALWQILEASAVNGVRSSDAVLPEQELAEADAELAEIPEE